MTRAPWIPGKNFAIALALTALSVIVAFGLAEVVMRLVAPQQLVLRHPDVWVPIDTFGWTHHPNVDTLINTGERTVRFMTDREGFRVGSAGRVEAQQRILLLGDSFMEALQVDYEQSLAGLLEQQLREDLGGPVAIRNTAVGGWSPDQYLIQARQSLGRENYEVVLLVLYLGNDIVDSTKFSRSPRAPVTVHPFRIPRSLTWYEFIDAIFYPINDFLEVRSHLFILLKKRARMVLMRLDLTDLYVPQHFLKTNLASRRWAITADFCQQIVDRAKARGARTLIVLLPTNFQVKSETFDEYVRGFGIDVDTIDIDQPNRMMAKALRERDLEFVDVSPALQRAHAKGLRLYGDVDPHFAPDGHAALADMIKPLVLQELRRRSSKGSDGKQ